MSATHTTDGVIPHLLQQYDGGTFLAPVKLLSNGRGGLIMSKACDGSTLPTPVRDGVRLVFALPGGGQVAA